MIASLKFLKDVGITELELLEVGLFLENPCLGMTFSLISDQILSIMILRPEIIKQIVKTPQSQRFAELRSDRLCSHKKCIYDVVAFSEFCFFVSGSVFLHLCDGIFSILAILEQYSLPPLIFLRI